jgi:predicted protein tyrosine phosphatase
MFKFKVSNLEDSDQICDNWATKCVSLLGPNYKDLYKSTPKRLVVYFDDIEFVPKQGSRWTAPTKPQIEHVLNFTKSLTDSDRLLVNCKAGVSRSPAMLIGILCQHRLAPDEALRAVQRSRPQLWPNNVVIAFCDQILDLGGKLIEVVANFKATEKRRLIIDQRHQPSFRDYVALVEKLKRDILD